MVAMTYDQLAAAIAEMTPEQRKQTVIVATAGKDRLVHAIEIAGGPWHKLDGWDAHNVAPEDLQKYGSDHNIMLLAGRDVRKLNTMCKCKSCRERYL